MNRTKLMDAIVEKFKTSPHYIKEQQLTEAMRYMSDANLITFANEIGVNTDELFEGRK